MFTSFFVEPVSVKITFFFKPDLIDNKIQLLSQNNNEVISCSSEEMYIDELRDLHYSISNNTIPLSNVDTALETQNIIESMKQSLLEKSICPIN